MIEIFYFKKKYFASPFFFGSTIFFFFSLFQFFFLAWKSRQCYFSFFEKKNCRFFARSICGGNQKKVLVKKKLLAHTIFFCWESVIHKINLVWPYDSTLPAMMALLFWVSYCADGVTSHSPHSHFQPNVAGLWLAGYPAKSFLIGWRNMCQHLMNGEGWVWADICVASCWQFQTHLLSVSVVGNQHSALCIMTAAGL